MECGEHFRSHVALEAANRLLLGPAVLHAALDVVLVLGSLTIRVKTMCLKGPKTGSPASPAVISPAILPSGSQLSLSPGPSRRRIDPIAANGLRCQGCRDPRAPPSALGLAPPGRPAAPLVV